jgi:hypothetical protein
MFNSIARLWDDRRERFNMPQDGCYTASIAAERFRSGVPPFFPPVVGIGSRNAGSVGIPMDAAQ